jgi:peptide deformylase
MYEDLKLFRKLFMPIKEEYNKNKLVYFGHQTLRENARPVVEFDRDLEKLTKTMFNVMAKNNGIGLAAPQIDIKRKIVTIDLSSYEAGKHILINPEIIWKSDDTGPYDEGCLSIPGIFEEVIRPVEIKITASDIHGKEFELNADGVLARVIQHEIDHLNGILFTDYLEDYIRKEYTKELKKIKRLNKAS